ncbi:hypothetical protein Tsp_06955 [Trichinella spiralis]|uniref:hypothetical protein n=1 Tax=Trichinella spiralis TaxID=6334 RepID=UPI0001EFCFF1|nr:hypothetical protein Tsp_06955 [Trichinella spiralis]
MVPRIFLFNAKQPLVDGGALLSLVCRDTGRNKGQSTLRRRRFPLYGSELLILIMLAMIFYLAVKLESPATQADRQRRLHARNSSIHILTNCKLQNFSNGGVDFC